LCPASGRSIDRRGCVLLSMKAALARLTIVVPVGPGDTVSPLLFGQLAALPRGAQVHIICADAVDMVLLRASLPPGEGPQWKCITARRGRAPQQNEGAAAAERDWLWFLHADALLAPETLPALERFIDTDTDALGYFELRFLDDGPALTMLNALGARLRSRWLGLPFGDQGFVLPRATFERLGRFNDALACGEDHDLVWRARRAGVPLSAVGAPLFTSARKYAEQGWWTTTCGHVRETWRQARRFSRPEGM